MSHLMMYNIAHSWCLQRKQSLSAGIEGPVCKMQWLLAECKHLVPTEAEPQIVLFGKHSCAATHCSLHYVHTVNGGYTHNKNMQTALCS